MSNNQNQNYNYTIDSKILFIDSNDRDIAKWPSSSEFEINCPQVYTDVQSLNLLNIVLPNAIYNISDYLQNNKLLVDISGIGERIITLEDGYYDVANLKASLQNKINRDLNVNDVIVGYNEVSRKFYFALDNTQIDHTHTSITNGLFKFIFNTQLNYDSYCKTNVNVYSQHSNWGLGYILGFDKKIYPSASVRDFSRNYTFDYESVPWIDSSYISVIISPYPHTLEANENIYIELEKYNKCDELKPYLSYNYNNTNSGIVNSAFAKVPISNLDVANTIYNNKLLAYEVNSIASYFKPPIEKLAKIKVKIRYHNNMLLNLENANISLTLSINQVVKDYALH